MSGFTLHHPGNSQDHKYNQGIQQVGPVFTTHQTPYLSMIVILETR